MTRYKRKTRITSANSSTSNEEQPENDTDQSSLPIGYLTSAKMLIKEGLKIASNAIFDLFDDIKMVKNNVMHYYKRNDSEIKDLLNEYSEKYFESNWRISTSIWFMYGVGVLIINQFTDRQSEMYTRVMIVVPIFLIATIISRMIFSRFKYIVSVFIFGWGMLIIQGNLKFETYRIYEQWIVYIGLLHIGITTTCLKWKMIGIPHLLNVSIFTIGLIYKYKELPAVYYFAFLFTIILLPFSSVIISNQIKDMLHLLNENQKLSNTIKHILEIFPESVIIQSVDPASKELITKFANHASQQSEFVYEALNFNNSNKFQLNTNMDVGGINENSDRSLETETFIDTLDEVLESQVMKLNNIKDESNSINQMIEILGKHNPQHERSQEESKHYTLKSIKVSWNKNKNSYMHLLIDTSYINKLQHEKSKYRCQKLMFASASHEFRTPMNAFSNSLDLIELSLKKIKSKTISIKNEFETVTSEYDSIAKYIKMGKISSTILINLVEDILDLEKFDNGTFSLNKNKFKLSQLIDDIDYIFKWQGIQKRLDFKIIASHYLREKEYITDQGRIKQVLINLLANSLKFTLEGGIRVSIHEIIKNNSIYLEFEVFDTGIGISEIDKKECLFTMFGLIKKYQNTINQHGTGIGLVLSKKIVESLNGTINVESEENKFTKITFTIKGENVAENPFHTTFSCKNVQEEYLSSKNILQMHSIDTIRTGNNFNMDRINPFNNNHN